MNPLPRRAVSWSMRSLRFALVALALLAGCATTQSTAGTNTAAAHRTRHPPDVHGDPLRLLPAGAITWMRTDAAALRASPHFDAGMALARDLGADFALVERELGFDPFRSAERVAFAVYAPPGDAQAGWPLVYARGGFDRDAVLASARARNNNTAPTTVTEEGMAFTVIGERAYLFPAPDVMLVMERALVRRAAARLSGEAERSVLDDARFGDLWRAAGGMDGAFAAAADLAATRARVRVQGEPAQAQGLELLVVHGDAPSDATVRAAALARDEQSARAAVAEIDDIRNETAGQLIVRLAGLSSLLREGIQTSTDGRIALASVQARNDDVRRLLRASSLFRELTGR